ncbi:MAG: lipid-binding SYLF domain-containing protein [Verrucomicrobiota bacterium]
MRRVRTKAVGIGAFAFTLILTAILLAGAAPGAMAADKDDAQGIVDQARVTLGNFMRDKDYEWLRANIKKAKGVLIYPQVLKAGFILGGSGGTGVLLARDSKTGAWSDPAFYTLGSVSFGLQIGGEAAEVILLVMSQKGVDSLLTSKFKLGGDTSIALGPVGAGAKADVTTDFISFAKSKGLYAGLNLDGSYLDVRESLNKAYYGKDVTPADIIVKKDVSNQGAAALIKELKKAQ